MASFNRWLATRVAPSSNHVPDANHVQKEVMSYFQSCQARSTRTLGRMTLWELRMILYVEVLNTDAALLLDA